MSFKFRCGSRPPATLLVGCLIVLFGIWLPRAFAEESEAGGTDEKRIAAPVDKDVTQGALRIKQKDGGLLECPLKHTDVVADVSGFLARVKVTQTFENPTNEPIEAVYVFPLPHEAAVDQMTMRIGDRRIVGLIKRREAARQIYEQALLQGQTAALLEQERPNIFTQSVGNIQPGQEIRIEISYVDVLKYDMGTYEFHFPMVVGPRFIPGTPTSSPQPVAPEQEGKVAPPVVNTDRVPDATRISPPVMKPGVRNGHDISVKLNLNAGVPIQGLRIPNHQCRVKRSGDRRATIKLSKADSLPNKDFVVRYDVVGDKPEMALLAHTGDYTDSRRLGNGYFMLMIQPKEDEKLKQMPPREIVFLVDVSGSMSGQPTAKVRDAMQSMLELCREKDTVQVVTFASRAQQLFEKPVPVNDANIARALAFSRSLRGGGGTRMLQGVKLAIDQPIDKERLRIVVMLSDGYIGNEAEIIKHVGESCGDQIRFWALGIGSSPNMFLIDGVARQGGGMGKRLGLEDDTAALTQEVMNRIQRAQLSKLKIDWGGLKVAETYPTKLPELWAGRPVIVYGRYQGGGSANVTVSGRVEGDDVRWPLAVSLSKEQPENDVLAKTWARQKIEDLMQQGFYGNSPAIEEEVTGIALNYRLMSQFTSFVAVDESKATELKDPPRRPRQMMVPVPLPDGTRYEGFFGEPAPRAVDELATVDAYRYELAFKQPNVKRMARLAGPGGNRPTAVRRSVSRLSAALPATSRPSPGTRNKAKQLPMAGGAFGRNYSGRAIAGKASSVSRGIAPVNGKAPMYGVPYYRFQSGNGVRGRGGYAGPGGGGGLGGGLGGGGGFGGGGSDAFGLAGQASLPRPTTLSKALVNESLVKTRELESLRRLGDRGEAKLDLGRGFAFGGKLPVPPQLSKELVTFTEAAKKLEEQGKLDAALAQFERVCLADLALAYRGLSNGQVANQALESLRRIKAARVAKWRETMPELDKRLDLVLRDVSLADALRKIAAASGVDIELAEGAADDAAALRFEQPRVSFLDLRGATLAESLNWILDPENLVWNVNDGQVVATSRRRMPGSSTWLYDVSMYVAPTKEELKAAKDPAKALDAAQGISSGFLAAVKAKLGDKAQAVMWYSPGHLMVFGDVKAHGLMAELVSLLEDANASFRGDHSQVLNVAQTRGKSRKQTIAERLHRHRTLETAAVHGRYGWQLLAASVDGKLDLEALTQLQIAWRAAETRDVLDSKSAQIALHSLWLVHESARQLPREAELQELAAEARKVSRPAIRNVLSTLKEQPKSAAAFAPALFATLSLPAGDADREQGVRLLTSDAVADSETPAGRVLAAALLRPRSEIDADAVNKLVESNVQGDVMVFLTALAARRAGGSTWDAFRARRRDLLSQQQLDGNVRVLINRLEGASLASLAAK